MIEHGTYWAPDAEVTLMRVPWDSNYTDVIDWEDADTRNGWFERHKAEGLTLDNPSAYHRTGTQLRIDVPYRDCYTYNYVHVHNGSMPTTETGARDFFYFVTRFDMTNPAVTTLTLQLDVWTTYWVTSMVQTGFLVRGHLAQANKAALDDSNVPLALSRYYEAPEGLDTGTEFQPYLEQTFTLQSGTDDDGNTGYFDDWVVIVSTASLLSDPGTMENPSLKTAVGQTYDGVISGCGVYCLRAKDFQSAMAYMSDYSWVSQCIVSITTVPWAMIGDIDPYVEGNLLGHGPVLWRIDKANHGEQDTGLSIDMSRVSGNGWDSAIAPYQDLRKLWEYPYSCIQLTNHSGQVLNLKPQLLGGNSVALKMLSVALQPFTRCAVFPEFYGNPAAANATVSVVYSNADNAGSTAYGGSGEEWHSLAIPYGDFLQTALWFTDFPQWSIVNNSYITYMASNANTIRYNYSSAEWANTSSKMGNQLTYDIAQNNLGLQNQQVADYYQAMYNGSTSGFGYQGDYLSVTQQRQQMSDLSSIGNSAANALAPGATESLGGPAAVAANLVPVAINAVSALVNDYTQSNANQANFETQRNVALLNANQAIARGNQSFANATQAKQVADQIADGNKDIAIQGIQAGLQDAALTPPSTSGQMGGNGFRYATGMMFSGVIKYMRVSDDAIIRAGQYFRRFGYAVNRYVTVPTQKMNVCRYFSYYKFLDIELVNAYADESAKSTIRGILYSGVTIWGDPANIGRVSCVGNTVRSDRIAEYY